MKQTISDDKLDRFIRARLELRHVIGVVEGDDFALELATNLQYARMTINGLEAKVRELEGEAA